MGTVTALVDRPLDVVWNAIVDAEHYPEWLLGAQEVDAPPEWPAVGAAFSHQIGVGPLRVPGSTTVRAVERPRMFRLGAGMGWLGESSVVFELDALADVSTRVTMHEAPSKGLVRAVHRVAAPLVERSVDERNRRSLQRLNERLTASGLP